MKIIRTQTVIAAALACALALATTVAHSQSADSPYKFERGYPDTGTNHLGFRCVMRDALSAAIALDCQREPKFGTCIWRGDS